MIILLFTIKHDQSKEEKMDLSKIINNILVPIDFSDYSKNALKYASQFAKEFNAKLYKKKK